MRLLISVELDTTDAYDEAVARSKKSKEEGVRTPAMILQEDVAKQLAGLRFIKKDNINVSVAKVVPTAPSRTDLTPVEKRRAG